MSHAEDHTLVGPYVLDALDPIERKQFEEHLQRCASCRADVAELQEVPGLLAAATTAEVSDHLRAAVLGEVEVTRQVRRIPPPAAPHRLLRAAVGIAAAVLAVGALAAGLAWRSADQRAARAESALAVLEAPDRVSARFDGDLGRLEVVTSASTGRTVVVGEGVPAVAGGRTYELWFIDADGPRSAGTFTPSEGKLRHEISAPATATVAITEEPAGGSPQPTGEILATATLPS